jgi:hypothetical protein
MVYYYKPDGIPYREVKVIKDLGGTMFWGAISKLACTPLIATVDVPSIEKKKTMTADRYESILKVYFKPTAKKARNSFKKKYPAYTKQPVVLCQDGATSHTAQQIRSYAKKNKEWLRIKQNVPYSPDMAPIEKVWAEVKRQLYEEVHITWREQDEVDAAAREIWTQLTEDQQYIEKVMNNFLSTCKKVIDKNGGYV